MDDALLLRAWCAHRDETALGALMERHTGGLRAALRRRLHDPAQVEDAVQAVWITLTHKAGSVRDPARLVGWLHACAGRIAIDIQRADASRRAAERAAGHALAAASAAAVPDDPVAELRPRLDAALARVSPASREAILRHYLHGQPQTIAAAACGISENAFAKRVEYGLDQLRRLLGAPRRPIGAAVVLALLAGEGRAAAAEPAAPPVAAITEPSAVSMALATSCITARHPTVVPVAVAAVLSLVIIGTGVFAAAGAMAPPRASSVAATQEEPPSLGMIHGGTVSPGTDAASVPPEPVCRIRTPGLRRMLRFAPSLEAPLAAAIDPGQILDVVDLTGSADDWLRVRSPPHVRLWVPRTALTPIAGRFRIDTAGTQARIDARAGALVVGELAQGEVVEDLHTTIGEFHAVHVPNATVYLHRSGIVLPTDFAARLARDRAEREAIRQQWQELQRLLDTDPAPSATDRRPIDWAAVGGTVARVAYGHPDVAARISAVQILPLIVGQTEESGVHAPSP